MGWLPLPRRSFLSQLGTGATVVGATLVGGGALQAQSSSGAGWQPSRHALDDWFDKAPTKHRIVFDTTTPDAFGSSILYANNFYTANQTGYSLGDADLAVVIVARHFSTPFAYNEAMWAKYGALLGKRINFNDPQTKQAPKLNVYNSAALAGSLPSFGTTLDAVLKRGVQLAVCQMATQFFAGGLAEATGGKADAVYQELVSNLVPNCHMVPAGIVAVNRAQERGYSVASVA